MNNKLSRRGAKLLLLLLLLSTALSMISSATGGPSLCYDEIDNVGAVLSISSGGVATCTASVWLDSTSSYANVTMELQRYDEGNWDVVKSWSISDVTGATSIKKTYAVTSGYRYRVVVTVVAYTSTGTYIESATATSTIISY